MSERIRYARELLAMARAEKRSLYTVGLWVPAEGARPTVIEASGVASPATEFAINRLLRAIAVPAEALRVTSLRVESRSSVHAHVSVWVRGKLTGTLVVDPEDSRALVAALAGPETRIEGET